MGRRKWLILLVAATVGIGGGLSVRWRAHSSREIPAASVPSAQPPSPSASSESIPPAAATPALDELSRTEVRRSFKAAVEANHARFREMTATRWSQVIRGNDAGQRSMLSDKDVAEYRRSLQKLVESVDNGLAVFAEAQAKGISLAGVVDNVLESNPEAWRVFQRFWATSERYYGILEQNWEEYYEFGAKGEGDQAKPWQREAMQVEAEMDAAKKELENVTSKSK